MESGNLCCFLGFEKGGVSRPSFFFRSLLGSFHGQVSMVGLGCGDYRDCDLGVWRQEAEKGQGFDGSGTVE